MLIRYWKEVCFKLILEISYAAGVATVVLLAILHCIYDKKRKAAFPVAELEKFKKKNEE